MAKDKKLPLISVVMLNWNGLEDTKVCIESLRKNTYPNFEIVIVDNGSEDGSKEWLKAQNDVVLVDLEKNYGVTGGHNKGFEASKGEYIANLNNDTVVDKDWLWALYRPMEKDDSIAVTGGKAYEWNDDNPAYDENNTYFTYQVIDLFGGYAHTMRIGQEETTVNSISTVGALMRRSAIEEVGYFDNDFFAYYDETDQFARFKRAGYKIVYTPESKLWHMIGNSTKGFPYFYLYQMYRNRFIFSVKNYDKEYLIPFIKSYTRDSLRAMKQTLAGRGDLNSKAQYSAFFWNILHFSKSFSKRKKIMKLGPTYNKLLPYDSAEYVSVVITCYNYAEYVQDAIKSVLNQTQKSLEIIVINDGSTDKSLEIIKKYKDSVTIVDKNNEGVIAAKNQGLMMAKGEWIIFLDADDVLESNYIEETLRFARFNNYDVVYTDMKYFGTKNETCNARKFDYELLLTGNYIHNSSLYKKEKLHQAGGYKLEMNGGFEDWELNISLYEVGAKFGYIEDPVLNYRQHADGLGRNSMAQKKLEKLQEHVRELHRRSYFKRSIGYYKVQKSLKRVAQYPLLPIIAIITLPIAVISLILSLIKTFLNIWANLLRRYIHYKENKSE